MSFSRFSSTSCLSKPLLLVAAALLLPTGAFAYSSFPGRMPNGSAIDGYGCINCHYNQGGGGSRNQFGRDMAYSNINWSSVCGMDSDGDGQTNGQELGDPNCIWSQGLAPARTTDISNPGVASSTSADPTGASGGGTGGGTGNGGGTTGQCPPNSSPVNGGCACDSGYQPNAQGNACEATTGTGTGTGGGTAPDGWLCNASWVGDGDCDCGCGVQDTDCADNTVGSCRYNDCDGPFPNQNLIPDSSDPTQCVAAAGGTGGGTDPGTGGGTGGGTGTAGQCPPNSSPVTGGCACDAGFVIDAAGSACVADGATNPGTGGGTDTGNTGGGTDTGNTGGGTGNTGGGTGTGGTTGTGGSGFDTGSGTGPTGTGAQNDPPESTATGCSSTGGSPSALWALSLGLLFVSRRRRMVRR